MHGGSLAGTIGSEETENLAALDAEADIVNGMKGAEGFDQMLHLDDVLVLYLTG